MPATFWADQLRWALDESQSRRDIAVHSAPVLVKAGAESERVLDFSFASTVFEATAIHCKRKMDDHTGAPVSDGIPYCLLCGGRPPSVMDDHNKPSHRAPFLGSGLTAVIRAIAAILPHIDV